MQHALAQTALAVDAPLRVAVCVANRDGKAAVVGPDDVDDVATVAGDREALALAAVGRLVGRAFCRGKKIINIILFCNFFIIFSKDYFL